MVHKRLSAEGLDHRVFRVENTVSDRAKVLKALQAQVPGLLQRTDQNETSRQGKRREIAARIDQAEAELDAYHQALYRPHPRLGYAYRDVLSRISAEAVHAGDLAAPALRSILGSLEPGKLEAVIGECAGLIDTWLDGEVEGSPLSIFRPVPIDESQAAGIAEGLGLWRRQEAERAKAIAAYIAAAAGHEALAVPDPRPVGEWLHTHTAALLAVSKDVFLRARSWYPYFTVKSSNRAAGAEQRRALGVLLNYLEGLSPTGRAAAFAVQVKRLDNRDLDRASRTASHFQRASVLGRLNPMRMTSRLAARSIMRKLGLPYNDGDCIAFAEAARLERETREAALRLQKLCSSFAIEESLDGADRVTLIRIGNMLARDLDRFAEVASRLDACPLSAEAWNAALETASQAHEGRPAKALAQFLYRLLLAKTVADARFAALTALGSLEPVLTPGAMAEYSGDIAEDRPVRVAFAVIEKALPRLVAYQTFRLRARSLSAEAQAVFRALGGMAKALRDIDASKRRDAFTGLLRCEAARHWKQEIEAGSPQLLQGRQQLDERIAHLAGLDDEMRDANRTVLAHVNRDGISGVQAWAPIWPLTGSNSETTPAGGRPRAPAWSHEPATHLAR